MNIPIPTKIPFFVVLPVAIVILIIGFNVCLNSFFKLEVFKSIKCDKSKGYCSVYSITAGDALKYMEKCVKRPLNFMEKCAKPLDFYWNFVLIT